MWLTLRLTLNFKCFAKISSKITLGEYIDFDVEAITSESAVDPTHVD